MRPAAIRPLMERVTAGVGRQTGDGRDVSRACVVRSEPPGVRDRLARPRARRRDAVRRRRGHDRAADRGAGRGACRSRPPRIRPRPHRGVRRLPAQARHARCRREGAGRTRRRPRHRTLAPDEPRRARDRRGTRRADERVRGRGDARGGGTARREHAPARRPRRPRPPRTRHRPAALRAVLPRGRRRVHAPRRAHGRPRAAARPRVRS